MGEPSEKAKAMLDAFEGSAMRVADFDHQPVEGDANLADAVLLNSRRRLDGYLAQLEAVAAAAREVSRWDLWTADEDAKALERDARELEAALAALDAGDGGGK